MISFIIILINIFGVLVSLFSVLVTVYIYRKYRLQTSIFFIVSSAAIFLWNMIHLLFNFLEKNSISFGAIRFLWLLLVYSGIIFVFAFIFGYSNLRYDTINWRLLIYASMISIFAVIFALNTTWVNVGFNSTEGWITIISYQTFWSLFSLSILIANFVELIIPLINTYVKAKKNRNPLMLMLLAILLAIFSNALEPLLNEISFPQAIRFLIADIGFLIFFVILLVYPFTGLYDNSILNQVIVADSSGIPKLILSSDRDKAILASGAIIGINSILEEITSIEVPELSQEEEITRKIELGNNYFYIIIRKPIIIVFQFQNPTGVCYAKFKSLARIFDDIKDKSVTDDKILRTFANRVKIYFENFTQ